MEARSRRVVCLLGFVSLVATPLAYAQPDRLRLEVAGHLTTLRLSDFGTTNTGAGARVSFDLTRWVAVEGETNVFAKDYVEIQSFPAFAPDIRLGYDRRRLEGFVGAKAGFRWERFGVFGKVRPGLTRLYDKGINCVGDVCALVLMLLARPEYRTEFALDLGGVLEFYPTTRIVARLDLGSTNIRHRSSAPPCAECTSRNFSSSLGVGFRF
jgi:hypothetical protein